MIRKLPFLKQFDAKTSAEQGRSMVEILGVLAVIGVLSAGGIYGYSFAMDKYRANDIVNEVNKRIQDTWHKYQDKPLPDSFDEWPDTTPTGFPINIVSSGNNLTFSVDVENVPNRVCQQVLNMNLNGFLAQMIRIVPTDVNSEDGIVYQGNASICSTYGDLSGMRFLATLEQLNGQGGTGKPLDKNGEPTTYCYTQQDCPSHKSGGCYDCINNLCEPDCAASKPYCMTTDISQHKCVECLCNDHCPKGAVCDEANNKCVQIEEECAPNHFRTKNGACMPCTTYSNIPVRTEPFEYMVDGEVVFKDNMSGQAMCEQQCQDEGKFIVQTDTKDNNDEPTTYCAYTCVDGYSYQSVGGCIKCSDKKSALLPDGVEKAKDQCVACGGIWYTNTSSDSGSGKTVCYMDECEKGKTYFIPWHLGVRCRSCSPKNMEQTLQNSYFIPSASHSTSDTKIALIAKEQCDACNRTYYETDTRSWCIPTCKKGEEYRATNAACSTCKKDVVEEIDPSGWIRIFDLEEAQDLCRACGGDFSGRNCHFPCTRGQKWRTNTYKCLDCTSSKTETINNSDYEDLCIACGRDFVVENGIAHCKIKQRECQTGEFKNIHGVCIPCDTSLIKEDIQVAQPEDCDNACTGQNGIAKRGSTSYNGTTFYCIQDCPEGYFSNLNGCFSCNKNDSVGIGNGQFAKEKCNTCPSNTRRASGSGINVLCERTSCPEKQTLNSAGVCSPCDYNYDFPLTYQPYNHANTTFLEDKIESCRACGIRTVIEQNGIFHCNRTSCYDNYFLAKTICTDCSKADTIAINTNEHTSCTNCGNRMVLDDKCVLIKAGEYGVCNNHNNGTYGGYASGEAKLFRSRNDNYKCELCTTDKAIFVGDDDIGREQCVSCGGNRQFNNGYCILGDCTAGIDFKTKHEGCQRCDFTFGKFEIDNKDALECSSECDTNKFVQQIGTGDNAQYYCVNKPTADSFINVDGVEIDCDEPSNVAIGIDTQSETFCRNCNRTPSNGVCLAP